MRRGFGCLFGLFFLAVVVTVVALTSVVLSALGVFGAGHPFFRPAAAVVFLIFAVVFFGAVTRPLRRTVGVLDELVRAVRRVEAGDYTVRVAQPWPRRGPRALNELVRGFDTMAARLQADREQRRSLLADVSHELRTPLSVIRGEVEAMVDGVHPPDEEHLTAILEETTVLSRLIEDLRTLTLAEAGALPLHLEPTDLAVTIGEAAAGFRAAATAAGVSIEVDVAEGVPLLDLDPVRMREVVSNLVANALRYTSTGGTIRLEAAVSAGPPGAAGNDIEIRVRDTGAGIAPDVLPHVFDRFAKSPESRGSGLGLAIAKDLVEAHGGTITAESKLGAGSTFRILLPTDRQP
jgi:two-component system, OmpR family, sensor histidine kinase BaeS